ncbi:hypothetical protein WH47_00916 [Habropoda laboriosa]|uniref:Uncharacterized protein n=1 Tax=Habropoda laboriosa TaxID=597456 RepID=A0A0L7RKG0_9HYME|nr:hypothetical protein WH47_00916 [Habropoda laboriosa]
MLEICVCHLYNHYLHNLMISLDQNLGTNHCFQLKNLPTLHTINNIRTLLSPFSKESFK